MRKYAKLFNEVCAMIERKKYLEKLISKKENGLVKVITGIRRCGKSYLLFNIYKDYLKSKIAQQFQDKDQILSSTSDDYMPVYQHRHRQSQKTPTAQKTSSIQFP